MAPCRPASRPTPDSVRYRWLAYRLRRGGVIAYPTEAVWGLGCLPFDPGAVARLLALKQRPRAKGLILVGASLTDFAPWLAPLPAMWRERLETTWPGPVTWLVPDPGIAPPWVRGRHDTVALRVSAHPVVRALCQAAGGPLVSTSANPAGRPPARTALQVRRYFGRALDGVVPGSPGGARRPTTIRDLRTNRVLREG